LDLLVIARKNGENGSKTAPVAVLFALLLLSGAQDWKRFQAMRALMATAAQDE
jgi:hypothetical protein